MTSSEAAKGENNDERIFTDPAIAQTVEEDPLLRFFAKHGKSILIGIGVVLALLYGFNRFQETQRDSIQRASDQLLNANRELQNVIRLERELALLALKPEPETKAAEGEGKDAPKSEREKLSQELGEAQARLSGSLSGLRDERPPFSEIAEVYRMVAEMAKKDAVGLSTLPVELTSRWQSEQGSGSTRILSEVSALVSARAKLDSEADRAAAVVELNNMVDNGTYVGVAALATLATIASDEAAQQQVQEKLAAMLAAHPEQRELLERIQTGN